MNFSQLKDQAQDMLPNIDKDTLLQLVREPVRQRSRTSETLGGIALLVAGIAIGLSAGLLAAPQSGRKLRQDLRGRSRHLKRDAVKSARRVAPTAAD